MCLRHTTSTTWRLILSVNVMTSTQDLQITIITEPPKYVRSRLGVAVRTKQPTEEINRLRGELVIANLREYARKQLEKAPPLTDAQLARLRPLFAEDTQ